MTGMQKFGIIFLLTGFCFVFSAFGNGGAIFDVTMSELLADAEKTDFIPAIIVMKDRHDFEAISQMVKGMPRQERKRVVWEELEAFTDASQEDLIDFLEGEEKLGHIRSIRSLRTINAIAFEAIPDIFIQVAGRRDVIKIAGDPPRPVIPPRIENDPVFGELDEITWSVDQINAPDVWEQGWTGEDIIIAIIDSGVDYDHSDLEDHMWDGGFDFPNHGYNFGDDDDDPMDTNGHGTHVSGIAAGDGTNGTETGVAPDAIIMALKTSLTTDEASQRNVFECHEFALEHGADVTSMSLGWIDAWNPLRDEFRESFDALHEAGIVNIVAAGNEGPGEHSCRTPADVPSPWMNPDETAEGTRGGVITVGASSQNESIAGFSSKGPDEWENVDPFNDWPIGDGGLLLPDVVAPGEGINSTSLGGGYTNMDGTSMAAPSVAGTVCLMLSKSPELLPVEIDSILQATADDRGDEGKDNTWGGGFIDAYEAVDAALAVNGFLQGTVTDMNDDEPLSGVIIELMERNYKDTTDENGNYSMEIVRGLYTLVVNHEPYLFYEDTGIQIDSAEITVADVELRVGLFETDPEVISITLTDNLPQDHILTISNPGSAIINVELEMTPQFEIDDSMDVIENLNVTGITGDAWISGMVYANEVFYVSGANNWSNPNYIYKFDFDGQFLGSVEQPRSGLPTANAQGMRDLAFDGRNLYGGIGNEIIVLDPSNGREVRRLAGPHNVNQAMVFDPDWQVLWVSQNLGDIVGINRFTGEVVYTIPNNDLFVDAMAYWPNERVEYTIYMAAHEPNGNRRSLYRVDADERSIEWVSDLPDYEDEDAALKGLAIIRLYNVYYNAIALLMTTSDWGQIVVRELNMEIPYATYSPNSFVVMPNADYDVNFRFLTGGLGNGDYYANLYASHNTAEGESVISIEVSVELGVTGNENLESLPENFALHKPYPNPFNSTSLIRFDVPYTTSLHIAVYDILGREVTTLLDDNMTPGRHGVKFDGSHLSSGIYFVKMLAGNDFSQTTKIVLLK